MKTVKRGQRITLKNSQGVELEITVFDNHLSSVKGGNEQVFKMFDMYTDEERIDFCTKAYGYPAEFGMCPECRIGDYEALTRLVESFKDLESKIIIKSKEGVVIKGYLKRDTIEFESGEEVFKYSVSSTHLSSAGGSNEAIFSALKERGLLPEGKMEFCREAYGYYPERGSFPCYRENDMLAASSVIKKIQTRLEKVRETMPNEGQIKSDKKDELQEQITEDGRTDRGRPIGARRGTGRVASQGRLTGNKIAVKQRKAKVGELKVKQEPISI
ncbi:hypothetical protein Calle1_41 [Cellulophaga phage Calle_1]|uniref:Uncharacterized protein n=1 Tax=Cellulophaga phage Calle_1 TaxID=2745643 RepID=A0A8E4ZEF7_9CAUD|nr:hypothetical protein M1M22_gp074 [Cellulophaga phage Calle_1]QQV89774.1 hypothetical protein Calle1_41 [Cellulophaga phage Calle_1]QQV89815.1 hypothetical protein Calle2_41 [Cellulophaga phage Calle_2]QQV89904.1 hypothetical protein Calle3_41 [Cellulophaga phage Calle_3]